MAKKTSVTQTKKSAVKKTAKKPTAKKRRHRRKPRFAIIPSITIHQINGVLASATPPLDHTAAITVTGFCNTAPAGIFGRMYNDAFTGASAPAVATGAHSWRLAFAPNYAPAAGEYVLEVFFSSGTGVSDSMILTLT